MTDEIENGEEPLAVFASARAPGWEWQAFRVEREQPETVYYGRVRSPLTNDRWEYGTFTETELETADAREVDQ